MRGKPYHIRLVATFYILLPNIISLLTVSIYVFSALYVVDMKKFRETTAGDNLRVIYETLAKDPNSLANLDQVRGLSLIVPLTCK